MRKKDGIYIPIKTRDTGEKNVLMVQEKRFRRFQI